MGSTHDSDKIVRLASLTPPQRQKCQEKAYDLLPTVFLKRMIQLSDSQLRDSLHRYLIDRSGNRYIRDFFNQYVSRYYTKLFYFAAYNPITLEQAVACFQSPIYAEAKKYRLGAAEMQLIAVEGV